MTKDDTTSEEPIRFLPSNLLEPLQYVVASYQSSAKYFHWTQVLNGFCNTINTDFSPDIAKADGLLGRERCGQ
jgi:hypothetical protein